VANAFVAVASTVFTPYNLDADIFQDKIDKAL